jgi:rod shape-determining protein MreC
MRNLLKLLYAYNNLILFVLLEGLAIFLIAENNQFQGTKITQFSQGLSGSFYKNLDNFKVYFSLKQTNDILAKENIELKNKLASIRKIIREKKDTLIDTLYKQQYTYFSAKVINNSVNKQYNYITLNKGSNDGIKPDMAVISPDGIVGVVIGASPNYSTVLSVLNKYFTVDAKLKKGSSQTTDHGQLTWNGLNPDIATLNDILFHVKVHVGDTLVVNNSHSFPEGIPVGTIKEFELKSDRYIIKVKLVNDFRRLNYVSVVDNLMKQEQKDLEKKVRHD